MMTGILGHFYPIELTYPDHELHAAYLTRKVPGTAPEQIAEVTSAWLPSLG